MFGGGDFIMTGVIVPVLPTTGPPTVGVPLPGFEKSWRPAPGS
jgi:hypothetical protein